MKTTTSTTNNSARRLSVTMKCLLPVMAAAALSSCGTQAVAITHSEPVFVPDITPVRVWHNLPAVLPGGFADDASTMELEARWGRAIEYKDAEELIPLLEYTIPL